MTTILVIEDDHSIREDIIEMLGYEGFASLEAANGQQGVELALKHLPDVIITDIVMPELTGFEVLERLSSQPSTKHIPIIFLTAYTEKEMLKKVEELGIENYLIKPFQLNDLIAAINRVSQR